MKMKEGQVRPPEYSLRLWQKMLRGLFRRKLSLHRIERYCAQLKMPADSPHNRQSEWSEEGVETVQVSTVQRTIRPVKRVEEYIDMLHFFVKQAAETGSRLVVFPEYNFLDLLGLVPGFSRVNRFITKAAPEPVELQKEEGTVEPQNKEGTSEKHHTANAAFDGKVLSPVPVFAALAEPVEQAIEMVCSYLAGGYGIYVYTGSYIAGEEGMLINTGSLYGPDGKRVGRQHKLHLTDLEAAFGLKRGTHLDLADLPIGRVVFPICMDATYFETFQIANRLGAEIVVIPIANPEEYNPWKALKGIWPRVQESHVYGIKAALTGRFVGMHYTGHAGIFAPLAITTQKDGIVAVSAESEGDELVTGVLDLKSLRKERDCAEFYGDHNPEYEREYVERTYFQKRRYHCES